MYKMILGVLSIFCLIAAKSSGQYPNYYSNSTRNNSSYPYPDRHTNSSSSKMGLPSTSVLLVSGTIYQNGKPTTTTASMRKSGSKDFLLLSDQLCASMKSAFIRSTTITRAWRSCKATHAGLDNADTEVKLDTQTLLLYNMNPRTSAFRDDFKTQLKSYSPTNYYYYFGKISKISNFAKQVNNSAWLTTLSVMVYVVLSQMVQNS